MKKILCTLGIIAASCMSLNAMADDQAAPTADANMAMKQEQGNNQQLKHSQVRKAIMACKQSGQADSDACKQLVDTVLAMPMPPKQGKMMMKQQPPAMAAQEDSGSQTMMMSGDNSTDGSQSGGSSPMSYDSSQ